MTYEQLLQACPPTTAAGDKGAAREYVALVSTFLREQGSNLNDSNRNYLYKLKAKWEKRAAGDDESWNTYGGRPGRRPSLAQRSEKGIDPTAYGSEDEMDPLLLSIMKKAGTRKPASEL